MRIRQWTIGIGLVLAVTGVMAAPVETNSTDTAAAGIGRASGAGRYAVVLFHRGGEGTTDIRETIGKAVAQTGPGAESIEVNVADRTCEPTVRKYGADRAPLPLVLVIAPNGAVTGGFPGSCEPQALAGAMVGPQAAACLKTLQDGKIVLLCVQNGGSKGADAALKTVAAFKEDERISGFAESVVLDPVDPKERGFLDQLKVEVKSGVATTLLVMPPGRIVGVYTNAVTKDVLFADLTRAMAGATCGSGCGGAAACAP